MTIVIVDTGCANIASVRYAVERLGYQPLVTADSALIRAADKVFLPGVGTATAAMAGLTERGLPDVIRSLTQPVLGICLGMQLLGLRSDEGDTPLLGLIDAPVKKMAPACLPVPHTGWNTVECDTAEPLFRGIAAGSYFYFVHSYAYPVTDAAIATTTYDDTFASVVRRGNFYGVQFHPERSGKTGMQLIKNFLEMTSS